MDKERRDQRRAAAQAFLESLNNLEEALRLPNPPSVAPTVAEGAVRPAPPAPRPDSPVASAQPPEPARNTASAKRPSRSISLADFEQAAADIEQYMQARQSEPLE